MVKNEGKILKCEHSSLKIKNELLINAATWMNQDRIQKCAHVWFHLHNVLEKQSYENGSARSRVGGRLNSQVEALLGVKKMSSIWWW